jgi:putative SOS response-associated peptidase YedK
MCGRFTLTVSGKDVADLFGLADVPDLAPRYNVAPSQAVAAVRAAPQGGRALTFLRWGLIASWAKDAKHAPINARSETAADKPFFRHALRKRRCLIPADGFYEWQKVGRHKQPYLFKLRGGGPFAFAGLWKVWHSPDGEALESCAILTTEANDLMRPIHDRMPCILDPRHYAGWLDPGLTDPALLLPWLRPYPSEVMTAFPVRDFVHDPRNEGIACVMPLGRV